jgi:O-antigen/teichoic acid export membrane protein
VAVEGAEPSATLTVRLAANTLVQAFGSVLASLISFATFVAVTRGLGPEAFGNFTAATAYLFIPVVLADVGLSATVLREISTSPERTQSVMGAALPLRALISAVAVAIALGVGLALPLNGQTKDAILIAAPGSFLTLMTLALLPVLQAQLKLHWAVTASVAGRVTTLGLTVGALAIGLGFNSIVAAHVLGLAATFGIQLLAVARLVPLRPVIDPPHWRSLAAGAVVLGLAIALSQIYFRVDALLLALLRPSDEVGFYGAAYKFIELGALFAAAATTSMFPPLARFVGQGDPRAPTLVRRTYDVLLAAAAPLAVLMFAFSDEIVVLSAGEQFREGGVALRLLAPYVLFSFANIVLWPALIAARRDRSLLGIAVAVLAFNVAANLIFIPLYGFKAAAVVSVVSEVLVTIPIALAAREHGLLPDLRYLPAVATATAAMVVTILLVPEPALLSAVLAGCIYTVVLLALPGTARRVFFADLLPAMLRALSRGKR